MKRLRLALLGLLLMLAIPVVLLVTRALSSIEFERRTRHEAVADRVFDEMERALSDFLAQEEARPAEQYRFYSLILGDPQSPSAGRVRSPLSRPSDLPFVIAHFQIDPGGAMTTPLEPADPAIARRAGDWPAAATEREGIDQSLAALQRSVAPFWREARTLRALLSPPPVVESEMGELQTGASDAVADVEVLPRQASASAAKRAVEAMPARAKAGSDDAIAQAKDRAGKKSRASAYEVLQSLNRGAERREARKQVVTEAPRSEVFLRRQQKAKAALEEPTPRTKPWLSSGARYELAQEPDTDLGESDALGYMVDSVEALEEKAEAWASAPAPAYALPQAALRRRVAAVEDREAERRGDPGGPHEERPAEVDRDRSSGSRRADRIRIILEPMAGALLDRGRLMLYRTVLIDRVGYRQGLLIDGSALGRWLEEEIIGKGRLADSVSLRFGQQIDADAAPSGRFVSTHAFAEPFDGLNAQLAVAPLRGRGSALTIYALAALLFVVAVAGLAAVYRMVAVVVEFAERRNNFVAAVTHELKTPLTAIRMYGEMLRDGVVSSEEKRDEYHRTISDESERLSRLIDNVLEFSRLEKGSREFNLSIGSLGESVRDICDRLRPHVERKGFNLQLEIEPDLPPTRFDRDALVQMVFNLIDNAMKYATETSDKEIVVSCLRGAGGGVALSVRDHGPGVPREHLARIFEPFFRGEEELTRSTKGSGIGLALVKELGESMGAIVRGANAEDGGFRVSIAFEPA